MGVEIKAKTKSNTKNLQKKIRQINVKNLGNFLAILRKEVRKIIGTRKSKKPRPPGKPVSSPTKRLYDSIVYALKQDTFTSEGVVGPSAQKMDLLGKLHEAGGEEGIQETVYTYQNGRLVKQKKTVEADYPARPFMGPAIERLRPKLPELWRNALGRSGGVNTGE